jgi:hypothetical protein
MYVPVKGEHLSTPLVSLDRSNFDNPEFKAQWKRLTRDNSVELVAVDVLTWTLDEFNLSPRLIKIDVEGLFCLPLGGYD